MKVKLKQVTRDEKVILSNLLEKYDYEFSQWDKRDIDAQGLYHYTYLTTIGLKQAVGLISLWSMTNWQASSW